MVAFQREQIGNPLIHQDKTLFVRFRTAGPLAIAGLLATAGLVAESLGNDAVVRHVLSAGRIVGLTQSLGSLGCDADAPF